MQQLNKTRWRPERRALHGPLALVIVAATLVLAAARISTAVVLAADEATGPIEAGQRVFSAGHSFHMFVPNLVRELAQKAGIEGHAQVGTQPIGGSRVIQHWELPEDRNKVRPALATGDVDVLTLSPIYLPDEGIEHLARLALEHNPRVRVTVQEFWLPYDVYMPDYKQRKRPTEVNRNERTGKELHERHSPYFKSMDDHVRELNQKLGTPVLYVVPAGQAVIALREKIIDGQAPGLSEQAELFRDAIGHVNAPVQALVGYCHFAVIYRRSPVGLPVPNVLARGKFGDNTEPLNRLLQQLAWEAVTEHPLSGVAAESPAQR